MKGEIFDTQTGGIQVKFTGKERLTTGAPVMDINEDLPSYSWKLTSPSLLRVHLQENGVQLFSLFQSNILQNEFSGVHLQANWVP